MKKIFTSIKEKTYLAINSLTLKTRQFISQTTGGTGDENTSQTGWIIGAIVVTGLLIGLVVVLINDEIWPMVVQQVKDLFNF